MVDYMLLYPRTVSLVRGLIHLIRKDEVKDGPLYLIVRRDAKDIVEALLAEGFHKLLFCENRKRMQIGHGLTKMLNKGWEMHVRLMRINGIDNDAIAVGGEVEISRRYIQHIFSARGAVLYELADLLKRNGIDYKIWNANLNEYVSRIIDNHQIRLKGIPLLVPWVPSCFVGGGYGLIHLLRFLGMI
ncbi:MAG: hypothetical protein QW450_02305 [Candidatus Nitrosocaldus sp.]